MAAIQSLVESLLDPSRQMQEAAEVRHILADKIAGTVEERPDIGILLMKGGWLFDDVDNDEDAVCDMTAMELADQLTFCCALSRTEALCSALSMLALQPELLTRASAPLLLKTTTLAVDEDPSLKHVLARAGWERLDDLSFLEPSSLKVLARSVRQHTEMANPQIRNVLPRLETRRSFYGQSASGPVSPPGRAASNCMDSIYNSTSSLSTSTLSLSSRCNEDDAAATDHLTELPLLRDVWGDEQDAVLKQKLLQCHHVFNFTSPRADFESMCIKQQALRDLVDYWRDSRRPHDESVYQLVFSLLAKNAFRVAPPAHDVLSDESFEDNQQEPSWPHLEFVYEVFHLFIDNHCYSPAIAQPFLDKVFLRQLLQLFASTDPRERECIKVAIHSICSKHSAEMREAVRAEISNFFLMAIESKEEQHNGLAELLEVVASIINGYAVPIKQSNVDFVMRTLVPLHGLVCLPAFHAQLTYCLRRVVVRQPSLLHRVIQGMIRFWPKTKPSKEILFLNELEDLIVSVRQPDLSLVAKALHAQINRCLKSQHFQVVQRTLMLLDQPALVSALSGFSITSDSCSLAASPTHTPSIPSTPIGLIAVDVTDSDSGRDTCGSPVRVDLITHLIGEVEKAPCEHWCPGVRSMAAAFLDRVDNVAASSSSEMAVD
eukprot:m.173186 g.173186  ORF g.173186 m.173186 type:complete len:660 (-) comp17312_c0_seq2:805-2784(-)